MMIQLFCPGDGICFCSRILIQEWLKLDRDSVLFCFVSFLLFFSRLRVVG